MNEKKPESYTQLLDIKGLIGTKVLNINCELNEKTAQTFMEEFQKLIDKDFKKFIVKVCKPDNINSIGLGMLINCHFLVKEKGGYFVLADLNDDLEYFTKTLGMNHLIDIYPSVKEAISALQKKE